MNARVFVFTALLALTAHAAGPDCGVDEHDSGGHCCRAGEDWVPAKRRCVCLEAEVCGGGAARKTAAPAPQKLAAKDNGWAKVGQALVEALEFQNMVNQMQRFPDDYARMAYAQELGRAKRRFTCQQIARLMATAQLDTTSAEIAANLYPNAEDPSNLATLYTGLKNPGVSQFFLRERLGLK